MKTAVLVLTLFGVIGFPRTGGAAGDWPGEVWATAAAEEVDLDEGKLEDARDYALTGGGSGYITRHGRLVMSWGDVKQRYDLKSTTKSFGTAALGLAIGDGRMRLEDKARRHHPALGIPPESNGETGWLEEITILHLASQTAGFEKPGGYTPLLFKPGTEWDYSDSGPNWLAECVTLAYKRDVAELMFERVFSPLGIGEEDLVWRRNSYRPDLIEGLKRREFGSGISANVDAMARYGLLWLRGGEWKGRQILPRSFVEQARRVAPGIADLPVRKPSDYGKASRHYGLLWWNNADATIETVPRDTYWSWGLYDSLTVVMPSLDIVVARAGKSWPRKTGTDHYDVLKPFFQAIVAAARPAGSNRESAGTFPEKPPYPSSPVIKGVEWAPVGDLVRKAKGSDNWPLTWGDDDAMYTAYGDGNGFEPRLKEKLSMGLARIEGGPEKFTGINLRSATAEAHGDGARGRKASGMLMVDGVLYMLVRNVQNAQIGWSGDRGETWSWADWRFTPSFGCPTFLNFGRNYEGPHGGHVYIYSPDAEGAYERADRMVLARVPNDKVRERAAYEFFVKLGPDGQAVWTKEIRERGGVFVNPGACYRSGITYNAGLKRYLWCQTGSGEDPRFAGGLGIYDAPAPWGPWTTAYYAAAWDVGPGESSSLPTKWMSADGRTVHLVFSGEDTFAVRRGRLITMPEAAVSKQ